MRSSYWKNYFESTDGVAWVVDSADARRLAACAHELHALLREERLASATLLVFANKSDLPGALTLQEIREVCLMGLDIGGSFSQEGLLSLSKLMADLNTVHASEWMHGMAALSIELLPVVCELLMSFKSFPALWCQFRYSLFHSLKNSCILAYTNILLLHCRFHSPYVRYSLYSILPTTKVLTPNIDLLCHSRRWTWTASRATTGAWCAALP